MKMLDEFRIQVRKLGPLKRAWFTTFNLDISFFETHVLPALLDVDLPVNRMDFETMQSLLVERGIDVRVFCDLRMMNADQLKRTAIPVHGILPGRLELDGVGAESLFHPKVIFLEDDTGRMVLGAGSANISISGWGRNQEVFVYRLVSNNNQYQQIKGFFKPLAEAVGPAVAQTLGVRRVFIGNDDKWSFAHSFDERSFLQQLLAETETNQLTVWSPYFSRDLAQLFMNIRDLAERDLRFLIVPDRVSNRHVRTVWTEDIGRLLDQGSISFHEYPSPRADEIEMTHAKLWLASGRHASLAVGSWNFTYQGCASFDLRNVEAGILLNVAPKTHIAGQQLSLGAEDFGSEEMLQDEGLDLPPYPLPFELRVCFDWKEGCYKVEGLLDKAIKGKSYALRLPGVNKKILLKWAQRKREGTWPLLPIECELADNEALLADHSYEVWRNDDLIYRGLVQETGQVHRRAQGYDSLKDLLNDLINDIEHETSGTTRLRRILRHDELPDDEPLAPTASAEGGLSYFRLFHAFEQYKKRLREAGSMDKLEKLLFASPGCVQELMCKVNEQDTAPDSTAVFNWFLLQEAISLHAVALEAYDQYRKKYARTRPPKNGRWSSLKPRKRSVSLPPKIGENAQYMRHLRELCDYGR